MANKTSRKNTYKLPINSEPKLKEKPDEISIHVPTMHGGTTSSDGNSKTVTVYLPKNTHQIIMQKFVNGVIATERQKTA